MLLMAQPDMGTAMVTCLAIGALLIAAGVPKENLLKILGVLARAGADLRGRSSRTGARA